VDVRRNGAAGADHHRLGANGELTLVHYHETISLRSDELRQNGRTSHGVRSGLHGGRVEVIVASNLRPAFMSAPSSPFPGEFYLGHAPVLVVRVGPGDDAITRVRGGEIDRLTADVSTARGSDVAADAAESAPEVERWDLWISTASGRKRSRDGQKSADGADPVVNCIM
jgi:hypothetical protein